MLYPRPPRSSHPRRSFTQPPVPSTLCLVRWWRQLVQFNKRRSIMTSASELPLSSLTLAALPAAPPLIGLVTDPHPLSLSFSYPPPHLFSGHPLARSSIPGITRKGERGMSRGFWRVQFEKRDYISYEESLKDFFLSQSSYVDLILCNKINFLLLHVQRNNFQYEPYPYIYNSPLKIIE